jgi:hypothetical protein
VELYLHSPIYLNGMAISSAQEQIYPYFTLMMMMMMMMMMMIIIIIIIIVHPD